MKRDIKKIVITITDIVLLIWWIYWLFTLNYFHLTKFQIVMSIFAVIWIITTIGSLFKSIVKKK